MEADSGYLVTIGCKNQIAVLTSNIDFLQIALLVNAIYMVNGGIILYLTIDQ